MTKHQLIRESSVLVKVGKLYLAKDYSLVLMSSCDRMGYIGDNGCTYNQEGTCYENRGKDLVKEKKNETLNTTC